MLFIRRKCAAMSDLVLSYLPGSSSSLASLSAWASTKHFLLDVDDALYHPKTGVHDAILTSISKDANTNPALTLLKREWAAQGIIRADGVVDKADLPVCFPLIVNFYRQQGPAALGHYLGKIYDLDYSAIPAQPGLVDAVRSLREDGKTVSLYTNGPWGVLNGAQMHATRVLKQLGFSANDFSDACVVDLVKTDRNPTYLQKFGFEQKHAADVFRKPQQAAFLRSCEALGIKPLADGSYSHVAFLDDSAKNFTTLSSLGVRCIMIGTNPLPLSAEPGPTHATAKAWSEETDANGRYYSISGRLLESVAGLRPFPAAQKTTGPKGPVAKHELA